MNRHLESWSTPRPPQDPRPPGLTIAMRIPAPIQTTAPILLPPAVIEAAVVDRWLRVSPGSRWHRGSGKRCALAGERSRGAHHLPEAVGTVIHVRGTQQMTMSCTMSSQSSASSRLYHTWRRWRRVSNQQMIKTTGRVSTEQRLGHRLVTEAREPSRSIEETAMMPSLMQARMRMASMTMTTLAQANHHHGGYCEASGAQLGA